MLVYNDVFMHELPIVAQKYSLYELQIVEISNIRSSNRQLKMPFKFNFATGSSKSVIYENSRLYIDYLTELCVAIKKEDDQDEECNLQKRGIRVERLQVENSN